MEEVDERLKEQVLAGIDFLNETIGPDWVDRIDPSVLLLDSVNQCVLGQLYGDEAKAHGQSGYFFAVKQVTGSEMNSGWARAHGFYTDGSYELLTKAWRTVLVG